MISRMGCKVKRRIDPGIVGNCRTVGSGSNTLPAGSIQLASGGV